MLLITKYTNPILQYNYSSFILYILIIIQLKLQIGSLVRKYATREGEYSINGDLFLKNFYALHRESKLKHESEVMKKNKILTKKKEKIAPLDLFPKMLGR